MASTNRGKAGEVERLICAALGECSARLCVLHLGDLPPEPPPSEDGQTYLDNARIKALAASRRLPGAAVLADDSGIEIDALGGRPGIHSARWGVSPGSPVLAPDALNAHLLNELRGVPAAKRTARMVAVVVLRLSDGTEVLGRGAVSGRIATEARGGGGFGFDSIFLLPDGRRLSEVGPEVKDAYSHRGQAIAAIIPGLSAWLESF